MRRLVGLLAAVLLAVGVAPSTAQAAPPGTQRVIVQMRSAADVPVVAQEQRRNGGSIRHTYSRVLDGFAADLSASAIEALRRNPRVASVVADTPVSIDTTQTNPPWGLDRIDQRSGRNSAYSYDTTGAGVTVYVVDSGIRSTHEQFGGRAVSGYDFWDFDPDASDCNGHGTHVAGTIGGRTYGVAKDVRLVSLRVFNCDGNGYTSDVIAAFDWAVADRSGPAVLNFSGGGGANSAMDDAVARATASGLPVVVAAGNATTDACSTSPARAPSALTVGASTSTDARASFSNYGSCLDLFAPGVGVLSSYVTSDTATASLNGTSMATPHVTGAVARYLQANPAASSAQVATAITTSATQGIVTGALSGSFNDLLYAAPPPPPAVLSVTRSGTGSGTVTSQPGGISCGSTCSASFPSGSVLTLTATPASGSAFSGWSGACSGTALTCAVTLAGSQAVTAAFTVVTPPPNGTYFSEAVADYNGWYVFNDPTASGGSWRTTGITGRTATFAFTGPSVTWATRQGPRQGIATVTIDGVNKGTFDLYNATAQAVSRTFSGLSTGAHSLVIRVTGNRNPASAASGIVIDAFVVGTTTTQDSDRPVTYGNWKGATSPNASGTLYRSSTTAGATATFTFTGTAVDWVTTTGPGWGRAQVLVDGVDRGVVDLYAATARWQTVRTYGGLAAGTHTITVRVLGTKNALATSTNVGVDGFVVR